MALCPLSGPLPSMALYPLDGSLSSLYDPLFPQQPSVLSTALCLLYSLLSPLWPSVPSMAFCPLYGPLYPLKNSKTSETTLLFRKMFCNTRFVKTPRVIAIYFV
jgi:hypothetical protein